MITTMFLIFIFTMVFISQFVFRSGMRQIIMSKRIRLRELTRRDIVRISHKRYSVKDYGLPFFWNCTEDKLVSCRYYLSDSQRLFKYIYIAGHRSVEYLSIFDAIDEIKDLTRYNWRTPCGFGIEEIDRLVSPYPHFSTVYLKPCNI